MRYLILFLFVLLSYNSVNATHSIAIDISYKRIGLLSYQVEIRSYTKYRTAFDPDSITFYFLGQGYLIDRRSNGPIVKGKRDGEWVGLPEDSIKYSQYLDTIHFPGLGKYPIYVEVRERIHSICNINGGDSKNLSAIATDTIYVNSVDIFGYNQGPTFSNPPILYASGNDSFVHFPLASDFEGDSIVYELTQPLGRKDGDPIGVVPAYLYPDRFMPGAANKFNIDPVTGRIFWSTPMICSCPISIAVKVTEYRLKVKLSVFIRDMMIIFHDCADPNTPPRIVKPMDTCIKAGDTLHQLIQAYDLDVLPNNTRRDKVYFYVLGDPLYSPYSKVYVDSPSIGNPVYTNFRWKPSCEDIRLKPYTVILKAHDDLIVKGKTKFLFDEKAWYIKVLPKEPNNLTALLIADAVKLSWNNAYTCFNASNFEGFTIWRKKGCDAFVPDYCDNDMVGKGFDILTEGLKAYTYTDATAIIGQTYSYRVTAVASKRSLGGGQVIETVSSPPSNEICVELISENPILKNVDVKETDVSAGKIFVRWKRPNTGPKGLDTLLKPGPYKFELYRSKSNFASDSVLINTTTANIYSEIKDTFYTDENINTKSIQYFYKVKMYYSTNQYNGASISASSVFLKISPKNNSLVLSWNENVPWNNFDYEVYKKLTVSGFNFHKSTSKQLLLDTPLMNDTMYCYYVLAKGRYNSASTEPIYFNASQIVCESPRDKIPPCPPTVSVSNDCDKYQNKVWKDKAYKNYVSWEIKGEEDCREGVEKYHIYFKEDSTSIVRLIDSVYEPARMYTHQQVDNLKGCYIVSATDINGNVSDSSKMYCIDNCPLYLLPNTFTPNGDGVNDEYTPFLPYRFVNRVEIKVYNKWGNMVFETNDPNIKWNGVDEFSNKKLKDAVYMYNGYYYINTLKGEQKIALPPNTTGAGYIHLIGN
jgi:gliding motility-associated-like protein